jgi:MinD-like ATPase involved in chromosome partitioning or flagellar assembly
MQKILLSVGHQQLEDYLQKSLDGEFEFVGTIVHKETIISSVEQLSPDILILRETLDGKGNIMQIIYMLRVQFPNVRIVFLAGRRNAGDALLANLVNYGVYDLLHGKTIPTQDVVKLVRQPNAYKNVQYLQPVPIFNEETNEVLFEAPAPIVEEKEVIKEVYIEVPVQIESSVPVQEERKLHPLASAPPSTPINKNLFRDWLSSRASINKEQRNALVKNNKQRILSFSSGRHGVGTTTVAMNLAFQLAKDGQRVIFIEINDSTPAVNYWFELGKLDTGIETAVKSMEEDQFHQVEDAIIFGKELVKNEIDGNYPYRHFPETLDFMLYSQTELSKRVEEKNRHYYPTKDLLLFLLFHLNYDVIVLDLPPRPEESSLLQLMTYATHLFFVVSQDVSSIGYALYYLNEKEKVGMKWKGKIHYVVNHYERLKLTIDDIKDWLETKDVYTIPEWHRELTSAVFEGMPPLLTSKKSLFNDSFQHIEKQINLINR